MAVKPGDTRRSSTGGTLIWTGRAWVPMPRLRAEQTALRKKIAEAERGGSILQNPLGINRPTTGDAERSWKSRTAQSGTVVLAMRNAGGPSTSTKKSDRTATSGTVTSAMSSAKAKSPSRPPKDKTPSRPSSSTSSSSASSSSSRKPARKATAAGGGRKPAVSQSNTMWVKKGTMVNGVAVPKGYLAQYGKPEKRVTANVRAVKGNAAGMKAGSVTQYKGGRKVKKGK